MLRRLSKRRLALVTLLLACAACGSPRPPDEVQPEPASPALDVAPDVRLAALARAGVWNDPGVPIEKADLLSNPGGPRALPDEVTCRDYPRQSRGMTPKIHCTLADGEVVKVKFGGENGEVFAEVAASRLLSALGFGADQMYVVRRVHCLGCTPHDAASWVTRFFARQDKVVYEGVAVERRLPGTEIRSPDDDGWAWFELDEARRRFPGEPGASRAELDALRLMAVLLAHWDNKAPNQRLLCRPGAESPDGGCSRPFAFIQDLGSTFGPAKVDLEGWRGYPVWADPATCTVSMKPLPYDGATFEDTRISEEGRRFLADRLTRLTPQQMRDLFVGARFPEFEKHSKEARDPNAWVAALQDKIRQIAERPPCPAAADAARRPPS